MTTIRLKTSYTRKNAYPIYTENVLALGEENGVIHEKSSVVQSPVLPAPKPLPVLPAPKPVQ